MNSDCCPFTAVIVKDHSTVQGVPHYCRLRCRLTLHFGRQYWKLFLTPFHSNRGVPSRHYADKSSPLFQTCCARIGDIYIYNSILIWELTILKSGARTPRTVTKFAVKTAIDLTQTI